MNIDAEKIRKLESECLSGGANGTEVFSILLHKEHKTIDKEKYSSEETGKWQLVFEVWDFEDESQADQGMFDQSTKASTFDTFEECLEVYNRELAYYDEHKKISEWLDKEVDYVSPYDTDLYL
jgi:hypothetical protein